MDWNVIIVAAVTGLLTGSLGVAVVNGLFGRKKINAEADMTTVSAAMKLVESLQARVDKLTSRLDCLEAEQERKDLTIAELKEEIDRLNDEIEQTRKERDQQLEINRTQGKELSRLKSENASLTVRILDLEKRLGDGK